MTYISHTADIGAFEVLIVELVDSDFQVCGSLELDKSGILSVSLRFQNLLSLPFAVTVTANLRVDDIKAGATSEIFQVLSSNVSPCPVPI